MAKRKEPIEREAYRRKCRQYSYGHCCAQSGWLGTGFHITIGCDGNCARMRRFDKKAGLTGEFDMEY